MRKNLKMSIWQIFYREILCRTKRWEKRRYSEGRILNQMLHPGVQSSLNFPLFEDARGFTRSKVLQFPRSIEITLLNRGSSIRVHGVDSPRIDIHSNSGRTPIVSSANWFSALTASRRIVRSFDFQRHAIVSPNTPGRSTTLFRPIKVLLFPVPLTRIDSFILSFSLILLLKLQFPRKIKKSTNFLQIGLISVEAKLGELE